MSNNDLLVKVENLYRYYDSHCAVENLNFELHTGEILGFLGPNGAGKTTTMHMLTGNLAPSAGRILINGVDILDEPKRAKSAIGYLPEQPPLYPDFTVDEYLDYCARLNRVARAQVPAARASAKERCGLKDMGARLIGNLSKGFRQRVGIAQAIIHAPRVVILDEPTVGLDPIQIREIRALITELGREHGVILSTHILPEVQSVCSRVQIIHQGRLVFNDTLAGLATRMQAASLRLVCRQTPDVAAIKAVRGVTGVEVLDDRQLRIAFQGDTSPAEAVAAEVLRRGWGLLELTPERKSLEQIFVELTAADENVAVAALGQAA
ncbi:MAG TPA: ATP-binding cassette domain-containing protein [Gammaproteobacteria bacterium]|nr:ATP-binding cassette domain-containing protein [Gammaproteobacteria bacterium]